MRQETRVEVCETVHHHISQGAEHTVLVDHGYASIEGEPRVQQAAEVGQEGYGLNDFLEHHYLHVKKGTIIAPADGVYTSSINIL